MTFAQTRRRFLTMTALAGASGIMTSRRGWAEEPALETTTVSFGKFPVICFAPQYICESLLRAEGFTDVRYIDSTVPTVDEDLGSGKFDFQSHLTLDHAIAIDRGLPITIVSGMHAGCYELFAHEGIRSIADLKGKRIGAESILLSLIAAYIGLDPKRDLNLVENRAIEPLELFAEGKLDAYLAFPPENQELHARKVGHVILRTAVDRPWSQYFCCMLAANREYATRYPVATKRVIRAVLKAADLCASTRSGGAANRRGRLHRPLRLRVADIDGEPLHRLAGIRPGRHDPVLRAAAARAGHDQEQSTEDHRRRDRLALLERGQARAEGVNTES
jgi:NitT/TauT family transport system substrate-binding protein